MFPNFDQDGLVYLSRYFNKNFVSLTPIREKQDGKLVNKLRREALNRLDGGIKLKDQKMFYIGSVDFMVTNINGKKEFVVLETNGGSGRGLLSLTKGQTELCFNAYKHAIDQGETIDEKKVVVIGTVPNDMLFQEKIILVEYLKDRFQADGYTVGVYNSFSFEPDNDDIDEDIIIILSNYNNLLENFSFRNDHVLFKNVEVNVIIGDGVARRFPIIAAHLKYDWERVKTTIVNPIYQVSDDKANTYLAVNWAKEKLDKYRVQQLAFSKSKDPYELELTLEKIIQEGQKNYILKPLGGSGGAGIQPISPSFSVDRAGDIIEKSIFGFYKKFDARRNPFPYTIQEMADFCLIDWNNSKRTFDLRIYLVQKDGIIIPVGGEGRIAKYPYTGTLKKEEFVVNLSGYGGVDINRAAPFSKEGLSTLNLDEADLVDMFCASCEVFNSIITNYKDIMEFSSWRDIKILDNV